MLEEIKKEKLELIVRKHLPPAFIGWGSKGFMCQVHYPELCKIIEEYESTVIEQKLTETIKSANIGENERPKIITIIGSTRYINEMSLIGWEFEKQGHIVLNPRLLPPTYIRKSNDDGRHAAESENVKEIIDKTYLHKVAMADEIFVVNINGYIGDSTRNELKHAIKLNKKIVWLEPESTN